MKRIRLTPRADYRQKVESLGFSFHADYWKENAYYAFSMQEIETIERATNECYDLCCQAVQHVIDNGLLDRLHIPAHLHQAVIDSWENDDLSLYGRFDFAIINGTPKLLEFNADTPTSLLEAAVVQWQWKEELFPKNDQFNALHESLVQSFYDIHNRYRFNRLHFACCRESSEDIETLQYLIAAAMEAGLNTAEIEMEQLLLEGNQFFTPSSDPIEHCFKLYPWEWMINESPEGCLSTTKWLEPLWKSLMSNKALLPILSELFPDSPYVLKCSTSPEAMRSYCRKPIFSREGANVQLIKHGVLLEETTGEYGEEGYVYQELVEIPRFDGRYPIIGSWVIGGEATGMGIRETDSRITGNMSEFIPHIIE